MVAAEEKEYIEALREKLNALHELDLDLEKTPNLDRKLQAWIPVAVTRLRQLMETETDVERLSKIEQMYSWLSNARNISQFFASLPRHLDLVFSHNDLLSENILKVNSEEVVFVDFEYAGYNYRYYDEADLCAESMFIYEVPEYPNYQVNKD